MLFCQPSLRVPSSELVPSVTHPNLRSTLALIRSSSSPFLDAADDDAGCKMCTTAANEYCSRRGRPRETGREEKGRAREKGELSRNGARAGRREAEMETTTTGKRNLPNVIGIRLVRRRFEEKLLIDKEALNATQVCIKGRVLNPVIQEGQSLAAKHVKTERFLTDSYEQVNLIILMNVEFSR